jgi:hypothetical protein
VFLIQPLCVIHPSIVVTVEAVGDRRGRENVQFVSFDQGTVPLSFDLPVAFTHLPTDVNTPAWACGGETLARFV